MAEFVLLAIVVIVMSIVGQIKKAQRKGQTRFKVPTPKSWQLPGPGQVPPPGQPLGPPRTGQQQFQFPPGTPPQLIQLIQRLPGTPAQPQQLIQPMPGARPFQQQVVQPMAGYVPPPAPAGWVPPYQAQQLNPGYPQQQYQQRPPAHRPPQNNLPQPQGSLDDRVRELMAASNEVTAVRLLCDEAEMGIIQAQQYARSLVAPAKASAAPAANGSADSAGSDGSDIEERWSGSAAFGTSTFEREDENVWASGWVDKPEPDDRTDITELWDTVRNAGRPKT